MTLTLDTPSHLTRLSTSLFSLFFFLVCAHGWLLGVAVALALVQLLVDRLNCLGCCSDCCLAYGVGARVGPLAHAPMHAQGMWLDWLVGSVCVAVRSCGCCSLALAPPCSPSPSPLPLPPPSPSPSPLNRLPLLSLVLTRTCTCGGSGGQSDVSCIVTAMPHAMRTYADVC